jgi:hypothetical protein
MEFLKNLKCKEAIIFSFLSSLENGDLSNMVLMANGVQGENQVRPLHINNINVKS